MGLPVILTGRVRHFCRMTSVGWNQHPARPFEDDG